MKIVFFGGSPYVIPIIAFLHANYDLVLVVTTEVSPQDSVPSYCQKNTIPFINTKSLKNPEIINRLKNTDAEVAILAHFGLLVPQSTIALFPKGIVNIHPSLLPNYRGTTPGTTAILNGDTTSGITLILLDNEIDHGPILAQTSEKVLPADTSETFYKRFFEKGTQLLQQTLPDYVNGKLKPVAQDHTKATFTLKRFDKQDGFIDSEKTIDKEKFYRMIRAYYPWPGVWTICKLPHSKLNNKIVKFIPNQSQPESNILIQVEGKKPVRVKDFLNGYPETKEWIKKFF